MIGMNAALLPHKVHIVKMLCIAAKLSFVLRWPISVDLETVPTNLPVMTLQPLLRLLSSLRSDRRWLVAHILS